MYSLPIALLLAQGAAQEARSALPGAPVVPHVDGVSVAPRTRRGVAGGAHHLADVKCTSLLCLRSLGVLVPRQDPRPVTDRRTGRLRSQNQRRGLGAAQTE
jgi:hypothetical protein